MKRSFLVLLVLVFSIFIGKHTAHATEGAQSYYFPGSMANFNTAVAPTPGGMFVNQMLFYSGRAETAVLNGRVHVDLKGRAFYNFIGGFYTYKQPVLGGTLQVGAFIPVAHSNIKAAIGPFRVGDNTTDIGDAVISAALFWKDGDVHYKLIETVYAPTGNYHAGSLVNIGRNYWGFDTSLAATWMDAKNGREISVVSGILYNTKNTDTDYKSGNEFHVDVALNQYFSHNLAVGLHGYYYRQVSGDSGSGAKLGAFKGEAVGIGPALLWIPKAYNGDLTILAKGVNDVHEKNRLRGDYGQFTVAYKF